ncbi:MULTISPECIES: hypothetical protein [unclassified Streptomyces]|jgi:hypothetical protein|uniref:hypothetical protein n=1 Tax=unclassified Streptomyces TaxID=2593676 RepID=UPI00081B5ADB|nr:MULTISPECIES: hypothetical protein [unclassified Streptomyces]MYQ86442.1 hypothetical protein [Streptomyces sp. SID4936]SCE23198.1 hypothetical protein GA0115234_1068234 [Streptomyces sp. DvalAA-43]
MRFREHSVKDGWSDWQLACLAVDIRGMTRYGGTFKAEVEPRLRKEFTAEELLRADAYLAASVPDTGRLTTIENRLDPAADNDTRWLTEQLRIAWERLDELRNRIHGAGGLMDSGYVASAIGYVSNTREGDA